MSQDAKNALMKFELENNINEVMDDQDFYSFDQDAVNKLYDEKPWKKDENYYKKVKISATALIKMVMHAKSGGNIEVMGLMQGKVKGDTFWIMDSFALPVEASETRVNAAQDGDQYMIEHKDCSEAVSRPENVAGWYHSHPGYGCWLSGIDVTNQFTH